MAELKFTIPDDRMSDLVDAWGAGWGPELITGEPNPLTKPQFAKEQIRKMIVSKVREHELAQEPDFPIT